MSFSESKPLIKGIKKEDNNCVLSDSKPFIKQEFDNRLNNKNVLKTNFGNNSHKSSLNSNTIDNQKNNKSEKSRKKKFNKKVNKKKFKTKFRNNSHKRGKKSNYVIEPNIFKELRVMNKGKLTPEEVQLLIAFKNEGVVRKNRKIGSFFKCLLCFVQITEHQSVEEHLKCDTHIKNKCEQNYSQIDSMFALDLGKNSDIKVLLARRNLLSKLNDQTKQDLHSKGIRVKNGFGSDSLICIECNEQPFKSLGEVFNHLKNKSIHLDNGLNNSFSASFGPQVINSFDSNNCKQINERKVNNDIICITID